MINLIPIFVIVVAFGAMLFSSVLYLARKPIQRSLARIEPSVRARLITLLLAVPLLAGLVHFLLVAEPCLASFAGGAQNDCLSHHSDPEFALCMLQQTHASIALWCIALLLLARPALAAFGIVGSLRKLRHAVRALDPAPRGRDFSIAGAMSFVAGWPISRLFLGRDLEATLSESAFAAVVAHERAHLRRGDVHRKIFAQLFASLHWNGAELLEALDLAIEQACDAEAANAVGDPLIVAQALIDASRICDSFPPPLAQSFNGRLDARIEALCDPAWTVRAGVLTRPVAAALALLSVAIVFNYPIHEFIEHCVALLATAG